jgi:hypothetical protein
MKTKVRTGNFLYTILISLSLFPSAFSAVSEKNAKSKVIDFRYESGDALIFNLDSKVDPEILNPEEIEDQYFLIRSGVKSFSTTSKRSTTYFRAVEESVCQIENSYDPDFILGNSDASINEKTRIFRTCLNFKVNDPAGGLIEFEPTQINCKIKRINDSTVLIPGGDCFIKIKPKQILNLIPSPNPDCFDRGFLAEQKISPMEIVTQLETFIYPEKEIGKVFNETKSLWEKRVFLNLNSGRELLETVAKEDVANRLFNRPAHLIYPDIMISDVKLVNQTEDGAGIIDLGFLLSGFGAQDSCSQGLCSNYQNYDYPFTPLAVISVINPRSGKKEELGSRYLGGRIPSKWTGELRATTFISDFTFEKGKKYAIDLIFSDPSYDFQQFAKTFKSKLRIETISHTSLVPGRSTFSGFNRNVPGLGSVRAVGAFDPTELFKGIPSGMLDDLPRIFESLEDETFPPEYTQVCSKNGKCRDSRKDNQLNFTIEFEVSEVSGAQVQLGENLTIERKSPLFASYKKTITNKPAIKCKKQRSI